MGAATNHPFVSSEVETHETGARLRFLDYARNERIS